MKIIHSIVIALILLIVFLWSQNAIKNIQQEAIQQASARLALTRDIRIAQLDSSVKTMYSEIRFWADSRPLREGMSNILAAWEVLSDDSKATARQLYITDNPLSPNYTADYTNAGDGSLYSESHQRLHALLKGLTIKRGYFDVYLIAYNGDVIYSVYKEDDYGTNLIKGKYNKATLAQGFREVKENTNLNHVSLYDFVPYGPSNGVQSSFIQTSIINSRNKTMGMLAFQLPVNFVDEVILEDSGLGKGVEIMAVGSNHLLRNRVDKEMVTEPRMSSAIDKAIAGDSGVELLEDYKGIKTLSAYAPFDFSQDILGFTQKNSWAIIVKQDVSEILTPVNSKIKTQVMILIGLAFVSLILALFFTRKKEELSTTESD